MQPVRRIINDAPDAIPVPKALRHRRIEYILWPLDDEKSGTKHAFSSYERVKVNKIVLPSREERNVRR